MAEVDGEGVEVGGDDDDVVVAAVPAPAEGSGVSVNEDMLATLQEGCSNRVSKNCGCSLRVRFLKGVLDA